ncbi:DNA polymerase III subunit epsilon [Altericroceibacterium spongiae]|uniref:DNA polymerase III subunit epsilon n=1 Tax=Altericroceibacterium spongiae TaxID=2320269 RepID=A0A420EEC7_9SPHN|nr:DNA polymerase III subunit epsilon [Altericroceibacterium spongiae]RKF19045.1 DNA polymerase III subunit epsilon [Altericroceibacterium spongiae]
MREIVFDTETTGLDPKSGDRLVEMGCVELVNRVPTGNSYHAYYNPERSMPAEAEQVHGLSEAFLSDKPLFRDTVQDLLDFIGDSPLIAHNAQFDFGFLNAELTMCSLPIVPLDRMVDTLSIARRRHPGAKHTLDALCSRYGVDRSHRVKHGALLDAELLAQVYVELTGGRQIGLELAAVEPVRDVVTTAADRPLHREFRTPRPHSASEEELARHKAFVETLDSPLWTS